MNLKEEILLIKENPVISVDDTIDYLRIPNILRKYIVRIESNVLPLDTMPSILMFKFLKHRKKYRNYEINTLREQVVNTEKSIKYEEKNFLSKRHHSFLDIKTDKEEKIYCKDILENFEDILKDRVRLELKKYVLNNLEKDACPKEFFSYVRFNSNIKIDRTYYHLNYIENFSADDIIVVSPDIPKDFLPLVDKMKKDLENQNKYYFAMRNVKPFSLPPDEILDYIDFELCDISAKDNIPVNLVPVFEKYKEEFDKTKNEILSIKDIFNV